MCDTLAYLVELKQQRLVGMRWGGNLLSLPTLMIFHLPFSNIITQKFQTQEMC
jgi:hypothetical protein